MASGGESRGRLQAVKIADLIPVNDNLLQSHHLPAARAGIGWWMDFYNERRPHASLDDRTPDEAYGPEGAAGRLGLRPASPQPGEEAA